MASYTAVCIFLRKFPKGIDKSRCRTYNNIHNNECGVGVCYLGQSVTASPIALTDALYRPVRTRAALVFMWA